MVTINRSSTYQASEPRQTDGWISTTGEFFPCGLARHSSCARELTGLSVHQLEKAGWVHISDGDIVNWPGALKLTQDQQNVLFDIMILAPDTYLGSSIQVWLGLAGED